MFVHKRGGRVSPYVIRIVFVLLYEKSSVNICLAFGPFDRNWNAKCILYFYTFSAYIKCHNQPIMFPLPGHGLLVWDEIESQCGCVDVTSIRFIYTYAYVKAGITKTLL